MIKEEKMSGLHESWKLHDLRSQCKNILIGCKKLQRSIMYSMEGDPRRTKANPGPMAAVAVVAAVSMLENAEAAMSMVVNTQNTLEREETTTTYGHLLEDVENLDIRKVNPVKLWKQSAETAEPKDTRRRSV